jgi:hypothetical protein
MPQQTFNPAWQPMQPAPPKQSNAVKITLIVVGGVIALCLVCGVLATVNGALSLNTASTSANRTTAPSIFDQPTDQTAEQPSATQAPTAEDAGMNQPVRDAGLEFTVTGIECGIARVGSSAFGEDAQGQFCKILVTIKNIGNEAELWTDSNAYAYIAAGQKFETSSASFYLEDLGNGFLENINPGNSVHGVLLYDIPQDQALVSVELHADFLSRGVTVKLS